MAHFAPARVLNESRFENSAETKRPCLSQNCTHIRKAATTQVASPGCPAFEPASPLSSSCTSSGNSSVSPSAFAVHCSSRAFTSASCAVMLGISRSDVAQLESSPARNAIT
eukprot:CAMPEP_0181216776 /NCGR_PEP_ID=MMETSP1096-20121128/26778_1 /TAXON_ID=156174 ORGANISM="Chrysochromulina ericina, Strain CCMP281" /NCGR_SAMPLE_ID=MMETSP1096 /ASSEMBLY_ACC=CAM_ASM_000453 /LENGTH=110 /DNA_ID=CAMNT_0023308823 /DNA_START=264 /DNA_END=596 /DNA_ORIENTATION=-